MLTISAVTAQRGADAAQTRTVAAAHIQTDAAVQMDSAHIQTDAAVQTDTTTTAAAQAEQTAVNANNTPETQGRVLQPLYLK